MSCPICGGEPGELGADDRGHFLVNDDPCPVSQAIETVLAEEPLTMPTTAQHIERLFTILEYAVLIVEELKTAIEASNQALGDERAAAYRVDLGKLTSRVQLPTPDSWSSWANEYERVLGPESPSEHVVSSVRVKMIGSHEHVFIWNRGALSGELVMKPGDGELLSAMLGLQPRDKPHAP